MTNTHNQIEEISDLINAAVFEVFSTMLSMEAQPIPVTALSPSAEPAVAGSVGFIGDVNGLVFLRTTATFARALASRMLDIPVAEIEGDEMVDDVMGELANIVAGAVKSRLCDDGSACVLTIPSIIRGQAITLGAAGSPDVRYLGFRCDGEDLLVELILKPVR